MKPKHPARRRRAPVADAPAPAPAIPAPASAPAPAWQPGSRDPQADPQQARRPADEARDRRLQHELADNADELRRIRHNSRVSPVDAEEDGEPEDEDAVAGEAERETGGG